MPEEVNEYSFREGGYTLFGDTQAGVIDAIGTAAGWNEVSNFVNPMLSMLQSGLTPSLSDLQQGGYYRFGASTSPTAPPISWAGDEDTGLFWISANVFGVSCGGVEVARFSASGNEVLITGDLSVTGYVNVGTATDASATGDIAAGLTGAARMFYDQSIPSLVLYNASNLVSVTISQVASTATVFNDASADIDFRIEGDTNANLFFLDASADLLGIGAAPLVLAVDGPFQVLAASDVGVSIINTAAASFANDASVFFSMKNTTPTQSVFAQIKASSTTTTAGAEDCDVVFFAFEAGNLNQAFGLFMSHTIAEVVVNEDSRNIDFRVESDGNVNAVFVDASANFVGILNGAPGYALDVTGTVAASGDVYISNSATGVVLKDTQGTPHYWRVTVNTSGVLTTTDIGTSPP